MKRDQIYLREIETQVAFSMRAYNELLQSLMGDDVFDIFYHAHHFLVHATNIDKLLDAKATSTRGHALAAVFAGQSIDLKPFRRLRNHLEHFDGRLDAWVKDHEHDAFFDMNVITGAKGFPKKAFLRVMDGHIFGFYGEQYDLDALHAEIKKISAVLAVASKPTSG